MEQAFISKGFSNWKNALTKFKEHRTSECHKIALDYEVLISKTHGDVIDMTSEMAKNTRAQNRRCFAKIIESLQYLGRQGLAIRGNSDKKSNFSQLQKL